MLIRWNRHGVTDPLAMNGMTKKEATLVRALKELKVKVHLRYYKPVITKFPYEYGLSFTLCLYVWSRRLHGNMEFSFNMLSAERQLI